MTTYTSPHSFPILDPSDKIAATGDGLREDLNAISTAGNTAVSTEGARAEAAAKGYADTKDTDNRAAWAAADTANLAEAKAYTDKRLGPAPIVSNGSFRDGFTGWTTTTGWVAESNGVTSWARAELGTAGLLTQSVVIPTQHLGKTLRLKVLTDTTSTGTFRILVTTSAGTTDVSFALTTGPFTDKTADIVIPAGQGATPITIQVGRSAGNVYMTGIRFEVL